MWCREEDDSCADVQQLKHRGGDHQVVEVALARLDGEADDAEQVPNYSKQSNHSLEYGILIISYMCQNVWNGVWGSLLKQERTTFHRGAIMKKHLSCKFEHWKCLELNIYSA